MGWVSCHRISKVTERTMLPIVRQRDRRSIRSCARPKMEREKSQLTTCLGLR